MNSDRLFVEQTSNHPRATTCRLAIDVGGTFTDLAGIRSDGVTQTAKVPSTPDDYARGTLAGIDQLLQSLELEPAHVSEIVHGTTVATNAILQESGARTALVTTAGFRDVLELQRIRIPVLYDLLYAKPKPLVPRRLRFEVRERLGPGGVVWEELDERSVAEVCEQLEQVDIEAVAVCLLHSYADPGHERRVAAAISARLPQLFVTCSADVLGEIREYERTSTTVINAYVGPAVERYLSSLQLQLDAYGISAPLLVMQCSGGITTVDAALRRPAYLVESGPAAGVKAAAALAVRSQISSVITLDMGGTTAKASAVEHGRVALTTEYEVGAGINVQSMLVKGGGHALKVPVVDVSEIGAGGGSIVRVDAGGRLHVGPTSAGASPGPAAYGNGGAHPTVTDAHIVLGFTNPETLAAGAVTLDRELAAAALEEQVAQPLGLGLLEAAYGVHTVACTTMMRAVKAVSTHRGRDPRESVLVAFGGNGGVVGADMARELGIRRVVIPPHAGLFSAFGLLDADVEMHLGRTLFISADAVAAAAVSEVFSALEEEGRALFAAQGYAPTMLTSARRADLRYENQGFELTVDVPDERLDGDAMEGLASDFERLHEQTYGHRARDEVVELAAVRVTMRVGGARDGYDARRNGLLAGGEPPSRTRSVYFGAEDGLVETPILARHDLTHTALPGPLIVEEFDTSCVVPPRASARLDERANIVVDLAEDR